MYGDTSLSRIASHPHTQLGEFLDSYPVRIVLLVL